MLWLGLWALWCCGVAGQVGNATVTVVPTHVVEFIATGTTHPKLQSKVTYVAIIDTNLPTNSTFSLNCRDKIYPMEVLHPISKVGFPSLPLSTLIRSTTPEVGVYTLTHVSNFAIESVNTPSRDRVSAVLALGDQIALRGSKLVDDYERPLLSCFVESNSQRLLISAAPTPPSCNPRTWKRDFVSHVRKTVRAVQRGLSLDKVEQRQMLLDIGEGNLQRVYRVHDIAESMVINLADKMENFGAGMCRARRTKDLGESLATEMRDQMKAWLPSFMTGMFSPLAKVLIDGLLKPILRGIVNGVVDAFVDLFTIGLIMALSAILGEQTVPLGDSIESEVLFYCPPALTIMLTGSITARLTQSMTGFIVRNFARYMSDEASPAITRKMAHDLSEQLENSLQTSLIHQLQAPLVHTLSYGLKDAVPHFYYCTHCYYYGDYCQYCFYQRDYNWLNRAWWKGQLHPQNPVTPVDEGEKADKEPKTQEEQEVPKKPSTLSGLKIPVTERTRALTNKLAEATAKHRQQQEEANHQK
eukprot:c18656_g1_i1.p1 GENE.c18656_g1_i1~~c18656_g1_i1.p1  ORF type:complete len:527 (-),score=91.93 c18656_g1_i1:583-2163(-)